jgi:tRNA1(Val) A37 N6-methylase TrmN6
VRKKFWKKRSGLEMENANPLTLALTEDTLLDGRVKLTQPECGYRVAIDPVLLAAAVPARPRERVLDVGAGSGAAALCLASRLTDVRIDGIELQASLLALAQRNVHQNGFEARLCIRLGDLLDPPSSFRPGTYDHVMANPPHFEAAKGSGPSHTGRRIAHLEGAARLSDWVRFALRMVKPEGTLTFLHRFDRLDELLGLLVGELGATRVLPLKPNAGKPPKRVLVQGRKGAQGGPTHANALLLQDDEGAYTRELEAILRKGVALPFGQS